MSAGFTSSGCCFSAAPAFWPRARRWLRRAPLADSAPTAAARGAPRSTRRTPLAERERLRADLARVQAEIDRLKAGGPGLRSDYVLRARLADAEALARRLTELDAQIKARTDAAVGPRAGGAGTRPWEPSRWPTRPTDRPSWRPRPTS